jgi:hypothetical protein
MNILFEDVIALPGRVSLSAALEAIALAIDGEPKPRLAICWKLGPAVTFR